VLFRLVQGRSLSAVGQNARAANLAGVRVEWVRCATYVACSVLVALCALLLAAFSGGATLDMGADYMLLSVAVVVIGGTQVSGGRADVAITSSIDAQSIVARFPALVHLPSEQDRNKRPFGYIVAQGDFVWTNYLNNWISLKHAEGFFQSLKTKWFNN